MFGLVVYGNPLSDILALSVNDVQNLYFPDTYPYVEQPKVIVPSADAVSEGLSKGAVAGIAVGCVVGVSVFHKKKTKNKNANHFNIGSCFMWCLGLFLLA